MASSKTSSVLDRIILLIICLFLGWFGVDKFYIAGAKAWKIALVKFLMCFVVVGVIWNLYDCVCALIGNYQVNPINE